MEALGISKSIAENNRSHNASRTQRRKGRAQASRNHCFRTTTPTFKVSDHRDRLPGVERRRPRNEDPAGSGQAV